MLILSPRVIGYGYRELRVEEEIRTTDEWYSVVHASQGLNPWRMSSFWTSDHQKHIGKVPYRRPVSFKARFLSRLKVVIKYYKWINSPVRVSDFVCMPRWKSWLTLGR